MLDIQQKLEIEAAGTTETIGLEVAEAAVADAKHFVLQGTVENEFDV